MHWWQDLLALIGAGGVGGLGVSFLDRRQASDEAQKAREHATREARASRLFQVRFDAYKAASIHLERGRQWVEWTEPLMGPMPEPPDIPPDTAWTELSGVVAVTLSDAALEAMQAVAKAAAAFQYAVSEYRDPSGKSWDESDGRSPRRKMDDARAVATEAIETAQRVMREELATL